MVGNQQVNTIILLARKQYPVVDSAAVILGNNFELNLSDANVTAADLHFFIYFLA